MNYIKEMNAFYDQIIFNPLSSSAIAVWHTLMHANNKSGWQTTFSVPASLIELLSGVKGTTFKRARTELQEKGYIAVTPGSGNQAATYRMISQMKAFDQHSSTTHYHTVPQPDETVSREQQESTPQPKQAHHPTPPTEQAIKKTTSSQTDTPISANTSGHATTYTSNHTAEPTMNGRANPAHQMDQKANVTTDRTLAHKADVTTVRTPAHQPNCTMDHKLDHSADHTTAPLFKQYINKTNTKHKPTTTSAAIRFYQENFNATGSYVLNDIDHWITDMGDPLVLDAMKRALEQNKPTWRYVKGILKSWKTKGITNVNQATADDNKFRDKYAQKPGSRVSDKGEIVPEWFKERKKKQALEQKQQQQALARTRSTYTESKREECERLLAKFSKGKRSGSA
ncbi:DnaD domain protein [Lentibacillus lipolyticus]|nr:DnaD domain protein [Lentibacillus lipolyticus]